MGGGTYEASGTQCRGCTCGNELKSFPSLSSLPLSSSPTPHSIPSCHLTLSPPLSILHSLEVLVLVNNNISSLPANLLQVLSNLRTLWYVHACGTCVVERARCRMANVALVEQLMPVHQFGHSVSLELLTSWLGVCWCLDVEPMYARPLPVCLPAVLMGTSSPTWTLLEDVYHLLKVSTAHNRVSVQLMYSSYNSVFGYSYCPCLYFLLLSVSVFTYSNNFIDIPPHNLGQTSYSITGESAMPCCMPPHTCTSAPHVATVVYNTAPCGIGCCK